MNSFGSKLILSTSLVILFATVASGQKFDLEAYLKKIDANRNGRIDESEAGDRIKDYIRKLGLDPSKSVSIGSIMKKSKNYDKDKERKKKKSDPETKVPSFGEEENEMEPVSPFGVTEETSYSVFGSNSGSSSKVSDSIRERVDATLARYDKNKNGSLDKDEIRTARWGSPKPSDSDLDKDGRLSRSELIKRYKAREDYYKSRSDQKSSSKSSSSSSASRRLYSKSSASSSSKSSRSTSSKSSTSSSRTSSKSSADVKAKYAKYAKSLISSYDANKDGKLSNEEIKKMRRPPVGADTNKDGYVSESELIDNLTGGKKDSKSSSSSSKTSSSDSRSKRSYRSSSSKSGRSSSTTTSASFEKLDKNTDKQVQMHEYSKDWNEKTVGEFYAIDKNGDGVISLKEWASRSN